MPSKILEVEHVSVRYNDFYPLHDITFEIYEGELAVIIGPNGAGKTTLLKAILGLVPYEGSIKIFGKSINELSLDERLLISYVPQRFDSVQNLPITVEEFLRLSMKPQKDKGVFSKNLQELSQIGGIEKLFKKQLSKLSGGELQRVLIVRALLTKPKFLLFDEPFSGVDKIGERAFFEFIKYAKETFNLTLLMVSHDVYNISKFTDKVVCVNHKLVCFGKPEEVFLEENIESIFGKSVSIFKHKICEEGGPCKFYEDDESHHS